MVNNKTAKIKLILDILHDSQVPVSGEQLAAALGVSRVAVWKTISGLKDKGYLIESTHTGYRLISSTDKPVPWEMGAASELIEYHDELDSTMHKASLLIDSGCRDGTTIIAGSQTKGQNKNGGSWSSPDGGLYLTRIRMRPFPAFYLGLYTVVMTAAAVKLLRVRYSLDVVIDWPGGIDCGGRKIGGLLAEFQGSRDRVSSVALGIGLNLNDG
ncbi:MAG TPA: hypothetical protein DCO79_08675, partial [Spirochaeta sp.]|nr:hypothetical protein [Spirochaeta sp.]